MGDYKMRTTTDAHNVKEIRDILSNLHDQFEEMNTWVWHIIKFKNLNFLQTYLIISLIYSKYEKLQSKMEKSKDKSLAKELSAMEKELNIKEEEINAVIGLYKEVRDINT